jgi:uncharacterized membrane protein
MTTADALVKDYLDRLDSELADLPRHSRREVIDDIEGHIAEARADFAPGDEVGVRNLLERLGDPAEIAADARERFGVRSRGTTTWREVVALILLLLGGSVFLFIGWGAGVILVWLSEVWSRRDKWVATLILPAGILAALCLHLVEARGTHLLLLLVVVFLAPLATDAYLLVRLRRSNP